MKNKLPIFLFLCLFVAANANAGELPPTSPGEVGGSSPALALAATKRQRKKKMGSLFFMWVRS